LYAESRVWGDGVTLIRADDPSYTSHRNRHVLQSGVRRKAVVVVKPDKAGATATVLIRRPSSTHATQYERSPLSTDWLKEEADTRR
jgi:hypothetical protein